MADLMVEAEWVLVGRRWLQDRQANRSRLVSMGVFNPSLTSGILQPSRHTNFPVNYRVGRATTGHISAVLLNRNVHVGKWGEEQINSRCPRTSRPKSRTPQCFLDF